MPFSRAQAATVPASVAAPSALSQCGPATLNYTATYQTDPDTYNVYVRMGLQDEAAMASLYYQPLSLTAATSCQTIGAAGINGTAWTLLGQLTIGDQAKIGSFTLASADFTDVPGASSPTVLLVSATHPVCQPTTECFVKLAGQQAVVHAAGNLTGGDTLHVVTAKDIANDTLLRVDYYVDNKFVYTKPTIEPFDLHYVGSNQHTLATVATYKSSQQLVITKTVDRGYTDELNYLLFTFVHGQKSVLLVAATVLVLWTVVEALLAAIRSLHRRKLWRQHHGLSPDNQGQPALIEIPEKDIRIAKRATVLVIATVAVVAVVAVVNSYVVQLYAVDGQSMESTYHTGNWLLINKLGATLDSFEHKNYVPKRGQVIVFQKAQNVVFQPEDANQQTFLVKRVIGLPGERVTVINGTVTVYNTAHPNGFDPDAGAPWAKTMHLSTADSVDVTLQPDEIFVCGDNRPVSVDSRSFGPVKLGEVVGNVL